MERKDDLYNYFMNLFSFDESDPQWKTLRAKKVTASIAAVIAGCSCYGMPKHLASSHHGLNPGDDTGLDLSDNEAMKHGVAFEPATLRALEIVLDVLVSVCPFRVDEAVNWIAATPDGIILHDHTMPDNGPSLVEAKSPFYKMYTHPPIMYIFQMQMQMHVYKIGRAYLVVRFGNLVSVWRVYYSARFYAFFLSLAMRYKTCIEAGIAPDECAIPMNPYAAEDFASANFTGRERIARNYDIKPHYLPPNVRIERICTNQEVEPFVQQPLPKED